MILGAGIRGHTHMVHPVVGRRGSFRTSMFVCVCVCLFVSLVEVFETNPANGWFLHVSKDTLDPIQKKIKKDGKTDQSLPSLKAIIAPDDR